jgi:hypothetical protein
MRAARGQRGKVNAGRLKSIRWRTRKMGSKFLVFSR